NHRQLLRATIRAAGIDPSLEGTALVAVDKLDKIGRDGVAEELGARGIDGAAAGKLLDIVTLEAGSDRAMLDTLEGMLAGDEAGLAAIGQLRALVDLLQATTAAGHAR